jgi:UPF0042 nucleotide-binding protein
VPNRNSRDSRQLVILTGLSGSGKSTVLKTFEDLGFYCVDNLPVGLIRTFADLPGSSDEGVSRAAILVDAREGENIEKLPQIVRALRRDGAQAELVFIDASDAVLQRRFSETRRPHPLGHNLTVREGLKRERKLMAPIRKIADVIIDTSTFNVHQLRENVRRRFESIDKRPMLVSVVSFGFRYGILADADLVFDVRFLPNPHFVPRLKRYSGKDPRVAKYIRSFPQTAEFLQRIEGLLVYLIPLYIREGKSYLTIAFGCTGGRHRSVMLAESVKKILARKGFPTKVVHRDMAK